MKTGLEEFLKRIEAKPTNETLIDRFMTLVLEEDGVERILYLKSLVGLLLKSNPYAALKAAYVELQEARKEKLNREYEVGALKDVESCFINLGKTDNAALVREEIAKLQSDSPPIQASTKPAAAKPSQKPIHGSFEFPLLPVDEDGPSSYGTTPERTRMAETPTQGHTVLDELSRTMEGPSKKPFENKPIPTFPDTRSSPSPVPRQGPSSSPSLAPVQSQAPSLTPQRSTVPPQEKGEDLFKTDMFMPKSDSNKEPAFVREQTRASPINIPNSKPSTTSIPLESSFHANELNEPMTPMVEAEVADDFGFNFEYTKRRGVSGLSEGIDSLGRLGENGTLNRREPLSTKKRASQTGFSLKDDIGDDYISSGSEIDEKFENQPFFQPDDDDEEELAPAERTMLVSLEKLNESKEQINLAKTSSASVKNVNFPVNSGPNFVVLDSDDDDDTATDLPPAAPLPDSIDPSPDRSSVSHPFMSTPFDPDNALFEAAYNPSSTAAPGSSPFVYEDSSDAMNLNSAPVSAAVSASFVFQDPPVAFKGPAPFVYEEARSAAPTPAPFGYKEAPALLAVEIMPDLLAPKPLTSSTASSPHPSATPSPSPTPTVPPTTTVSPQATAPFNLEPDFMGITPFSASAPTPVPRAELQVKVEVQPMPTASMPVFASSPTAMGDTVATGQKPTPAAAYQVSAPFIVKIEEPDPLLSYPEANESFKITPKPILETPTRQNLAMKDGDEEIDYRYKDEPVASRSRSRSRPWPTADSGEELFEEEANSLSLVPQATFIQKWTLVQERLKLLSGLQIGRSHAVDFVKRLLAVKNENPVVIKTLNLLLQFVEVKLDKALCTRIATWLFEELHPRAMHQLWKSLNLQEEGLELYLLYVNDLIKLHQHRRALSIMHDILRFDLDSAWYVESYPYLLRTWERLGLEGWIWLEEEGGTVFCDRLARREDPLLATLLI